MNIKTTEQRLLDLEDRVARLETTQTPVSPGNNTQITQKKFSAKEFLMNQELKSEIQKTLALGYYLEHTEGLSSFNVNDLVSVFQSAKEKRPKNMNDAVNKNVARGLLMEAGEKRDGMKAWVLTRSGEQYIETNFLK